MKTTITIELSTRKLLNKIKYELDCKNLDDTILRLITVASKVSTADKISKIKTTSTPLKFGGNSA